VEVLAPLHDAIIRADNRAMSNHTSRPTGYFRNILRAGKQGMGHHLASYWATSRACARVMTTGSSIAGTIAEMNFGARRMKDGAVGVSTSLEYAPRRMPRRRACESPRGLEV